MLSINSVTQPASQKNRERAANALKALKQRADLGFIRLPLQTDSWQQCVQYANKLSGSYDHLVVIGIGGSSLAPKAIYKALGSSVQMHFLDNVDAMAVAKTLSQFKDLSRVHWLLISKTGGTLETLTLADFVYQHLKSNGLKFSSHCTVISETKSSVLTDWAKKNDVFQLDLPVDVGGRFSVFTPVGMLPAAISGLDVFAFQRGAQFLLNHEELVEEFVALSLDSLEREEWLTVFWIYSSLFAEGGRWIQQLWAESLAKKQTRQGKPAPQVSVPLSLIGSTDQHSVLQQISQGQEKKFIWFLRVRQAEQQGLPMTDGYFFEKTGMKNKSLGQMLKAFAQSTQRSLFEGGTHSAVLEMETLDEKNLGAFFMLLMLSVGAMGEALDINAFDQPGVELGKRLVSSYL